MATRTHNLHTGRLMMNGPNGLYVHLRGEKVGDWKMKKCICCCILEILHLFEDLIQFLINDTEERS